MIGNLFNGFFLPYELRTEIEQKMYQSDSIRRESVWCTENEMKHAMKKKLYDTFLCLRCRIVDVFLINKS